MTQFTRAPGEIKIIALGTGTNESTCNGLITLGKDVTILGDLIVNGAFSGGTSTSSPNFLDKRITLNDIALPTDSNANTGGMELKATTDRTFFWYNSTNAWTSNVNMDLSDATKTYKIGGTTVISSTALGVGIAVDGGSF